MDVICRIDKEVVFSSRSGYYGPMQATTFRNAFQASVPVLLGYVSIGMAFGFLLVKSGMHWMWAPLMGICVYTGAAQFLAIGFITSGSPFAEIFTAVLLLNARHMVYGLSFLERFRKPGFGGWYLKFALTDETYGLLSTLQAPQGSDPHQFDIAITALNQSYWLIGSVLGALFGTLVQYNLPGIEFSMTALFTVLLVEQIRSLKKASPFVLALGICIIIQIAGLGDQLLMLGVLGSAAGVLLLESRSGKQEPA